MAIFESTNQEHVVGGVELRGLRTNMEKGFQHDVARQSRARLSRYSRSRAF